MKIKVLSCNVFKHEIQAVQNASPHELDIEYFELGEHARPAELRSKLQRAVDQTQGFDAILLCYGLCGRATDGLTAGEIPLILPRSHDCCGILLGSRKRFEELFRPMPSTPFSSIGFVENGDYFFNDGEVVHGDAYAELVAQYGEEDARYIWDAMHPTLDGVLQPVFFVHTVEAAEALRQCRERAEAEGREVRELNGSLRLVTMALAGDWPDDEFLRVPAGHTIHLVGDWDRIVRADI